jgi:folate-binding protein YgfZ
MHASTALRLTGRDALPLLHRITSNALDRLEPGDARATLWCDFRGRLQHRAVVAVARDGAVWLLRPDAPGATLAAALDRAIFRDDVQVEDRSATVPVTLVRGAAGDQGVLEEADGVPRIVATGDGTRLVVGTSAEPLTERERIALLHPRHGHEIAEAFNPFEAGLGHEVHLAKGCFTGQEALQRLITYESVRRRPVQVRLPFPAEDVPQDVLAHGKPAGVLTSAVDGEGLAIVKHDVIEERAPLSLEAGGALEVVAAPEPARPQGRG